MGFDPQWNNVLPDSATESQGQFSIGGCKISELASRYGTPLYVYDDDTLRNQARRIRQAFAPLQARVSFAAKACATVGVLRILREEGLDLDVVSEGEIEAARRAGFRPDQMHLHGNAKSRSELETAARRGLRAVVLDNPEEINTLETVSRRSKRSCGVILRLALRLEAQTHPHLQTSGLQSKFGFLEGSRELDDAVDRLRRSHRLQLIGIHAHLGSQISDPCIFGQAAGQLVQRSEILRACGFPVEEISVGGGWLVAYRPDETFMEPEHVARALQPVFDLHPNLRAAVEPGRAVVARAAIAVYRVNSVKFRGRSRIVAVDGGMGDNPRPALYGASYTAFLPGRRSEPVEGPAVIVGRYCESGDVLARDVDLPAVSAGDLLCIPVSGAYHLSMASSYNLVPQPAVVLAGGGSARLLTRRATLDDLLVREVDSGS